MAVKSHFSQWGTVTDVYFPRHKKTLKRRPFCFVTFSSADAVHRALAESPLSIAGHPIKSLTAVEERDAYYREKHATGGLGQPPLAGYGAGQAANPFAALPLARGGPAPLAQQPGRVPAPRPGALPLAHARAGPGLRRRPRL